MLLPTHRALPRRGWGFAVALAFATGACTAEGAVELEFLLPEADELSPVSSQLAEITLVTTLPGEGVRSESRSIVDRADALGLGRVPVGDGLQLAVELRSPTQRLIGYGRGPGPISVRVGERTRVPMRVRRPFAYVASAEGVATFDTTREGRFSGYRGAIALPRPPTVVVPTEDGADLIALASTGEGGEMVLVSTSTHQPAGMPPVVLSRPPVEAAVSFDSRYVVIAHDGAAGGLSIVDLQSVRDGGDGQVVFVELGSVGAVALLPGESPDDPGRAFALLERSREIGCPQDASNSTIIEVPLAAPERAGGTISFDVPIHDLAATAGSLVVADGCNSRLERIDPDDDAQREELTSVRQASAVAVLGTRVWGVGTLPAQGDTGARLLLVSIDVDGTGEKRDELPELQERAVSDQFDAEGQAAINTLDADQAWAYDLAVVPGADQIALLTWSYFHGIEQGNFFGQPIIPDMELETFEYYLINASTAGVVQRLRAACSLELNIDEFNPPVLTEWTCGAAPEQDVPASEYLPMQLSILYGGR